MVFHNFINNNKLLIKIMESNVITPATVDIKQVEKEEFVKFELTTKNKNLIINDILSQLVDVIQKKYDMSTFTLNFIFNNKEFIEICNQVAKDLYEDVFVKTFNTVESYVDILNNLKSINGALALLYERYNIMKEINDKINNAITASDLQPQLLACIRAKVKKKRPNPNDKNP